MKVYRKVTEAMFSGTDERLRGWSYFEFPKISGLSNFFVVNAPTSF